MQGGGEAFASDCDQASTTADVKRITKQKGKCNSCDLISLLESDKKAAETIVQPKSAFNKTESQMLINENINGIPAKEIKLAKILMDKPAPHCSAQSWSIYD